MTDVELVWKVPPPGLPILPARRGVMATPLAMPTMHDLATIVRNLASARSLHAGVVQLQREICKLLRVSDALCAWIDWPRRIAWTISGKLGDQVQDLVMEAGGSGRRVFLGGAVIEPLGRPPTHSVIALRKPSGISFSSSELTMIATLGAGIAPVLARLIAAEP